MTQPFNPKGTLSKLVENRRHGASTRENKIFKDKLVAAEQKAHDQVLAFTNASVMVAYSDDFRACLIEAARENIGQEFYWAFVDNLNALNQSFKPGDETSPVERAATNAGLLGPKLFQGSIDKLTSGYMEQDMIHLLDIATDPKLLPVDQVKAIDSLIGQVVEAVNFMERTNFIKESFEKAQPMSDFLAPPADEPLKRTEWVVLNQKAEEAQKLDQGNIKHSLALSSELAKEALSLRQVAPARISALATR